MAKKLIVANWKMHFTVGEASVYLHKLQQKIPEHRGVEVVLCPNTLALQSLSMQVGRQFKLGAQNCYYKDEGAFTGEVSAAMLHGLVRYVIIGHSERRHIFGEQDKHVALKMQAAVRNQITPIMCVGETKQERDEGETKHVLHAQVAAGLSNLTNQDIPEIVVAYEPVWAIGTGEFAKVEDAVQAIKYIRKQISVVYGDNAAAKVRMLYGGSVDADNAGAYLAAQGIDGLLIGGSSLKADVFTNIVSKAHSLVTA